MVYARISGRLLGAPMETDLTTTVSITSLNKQRDITRDLLGSVVRSDWSYSVDVEIEVTGGGESATHAVSIYLDEYQYDTLLKAELHAHEMFKAQVEGKLGALRTVLDKAKD